MYAKGSITRSVFGQWTWAAALALALVGSTSCNGDNGAPGAPGAPGGGGTTSSTLSRGDALPGITLAISKVSGATGTGGAFAVGDKLTVHFTAKKADGTDWDITEFAFGRIMVSGPTFNYQRVIAEQSDLATHSVKHGDGSYSYTFTSPIPATYLPPLNDTATFGAADGELQGTALLSGTYTVGMYVGWNYTLNSQPMRDAGDATFDFVFGSPGAATAREVVKQDNCNQCHQSLRAHGGLRRSVGLCVLCHTAGAEDKNDPNVLNGTPNVTIDFKVMIHKIHAGSHLPSVLGVSTNPDGSRNYAATPAPYQIVGFQNSVSDFSDVNFPVWPNALIPMPRDLGYSALTSGQKALEDTIREGPANCAVCHGDPDGAGPLTAPAQGGLYKSQPSQAACGACHDDVVFGNPYTSNGQTMGAQANNSNCLLCHDSPGASIDIAEAHVHPLKKSVWPNTTNPGVNFAITSVAEAGTNDGDGTIDPGEKIALTFTVKDDSGADVAFSSLASNTLLISGPTSNLNIVLNTSIPAAALAAATQPYTVNVPMVQNLEFVGTSDGALNNFATAFAPHWNVTGAATTVFARTANLGSTNLAQPTTAPQNYIDTTGTAGFLRDDIIAVDDGVANLKEYVKVQFVDGNRLWFGSPGSSSYPMGLFKAHSAGAVVEKVTLTAKTVNTDYTLNATTGAIAELVEFGNVDVVVTYTTDFVMPSVHTLAINGSPGLDETCGKWTGKSLVDGTYTLTLFGSESLNWVQFGETTSYRPAAVAAKQDFLVGSATTLAPYALISSGQNCNACHQDVAFHGGSRRGVDACIACHGTAGSEDRPQYVAANAPATDGVTINFRTMLHKIHRGEDLANASTYNVIGFGAGAYPNNFSVTEYSDVVFPDMPSGVQDCAKCHGTSNTAWYEPSDRNHPTDQVKPVLKWTAVCGACHDDDATQAHISIQTFQGVESCEICHDSTGEWNVAKMHKIY